MMKGTQLVQRKLTVAEHGEILLYILYLMKLSGADGVDSLEATISSSFYQDSESP